jgi:hypothetical protein
MNQDFEDFSHWVCTKITFRYYGKWVLDFYIKLINRGLGNDNKCTWLLCVYEDFSH